MLNQSRIVLPLLVTVVLSLTACGGSGDGDDDSSGDGSFVGGGDGDDDSSGDGSFVGGGDDNATGGFNLNGDDTSVFGTYLEAGAVGATLSDAATGQGYIAIVDEGKSVTDSMSIDFGDAEKALNGFVMAVSWIGSGNNVLKSVSVTIWSDGVDFYYSCITPVSTSGDCGGMESISLDILSGTVTLNDTTVFNADSGTELTLDGTVTWN